MNKDTSTRKTPSILSTGAPWLLAVVLTVLAPSARAGDFGLLQCAVGNDACPSGGAGDDDGNLDPGEDAELELTLTYTGDVELTDVSISVTAAPPELAFGGAVVVPSVLPGETFSVALPFGVAADVPCGSVLTVAGEVTHEDGVLETFACVVDVAIDCAPCVHASPGIEVTSCVASEDACATGGAGDGDGSLDPGEIAELGIVFTYTGDVELTDVVVSVVAAPPELIFSGDGTVVVPSVSPGETVSVALPFSVAFDVPCGTVLTVAVDVTHEGEELAFFACVIDIAVDCTPCEEDATGGVIVIVGPGVIVGWDETMLPGSFLHVGSIRSLREIGVYDHAAHRCDVRTGDMVADVPGDVYFLVEGGDGSLGRSSLGVQRPLADPGCH